VDDQGPYTAIARGVAAANTMEISPQALGSNTMLDMTTKEILFGALLEEYRIESRELAQCVQGVLGGRMVIYGRGIYGNKGLRVLRFTRCPGVLVEVGFLSVLHTWGRTLEFHPHIHYIVPGGALSSTDGLWHPSRIDFYLPVKALSQIFKAKFRDAMREAGQT
jgi:hypothetical protein